MKTRALWLVLLLFPLLATAQEPAGTEPQVETYTEGTDYQPIKPPLPLSEPGGIEVAELYWYGCPHCHSFEPYVKEWLAKKPSEVNFVRIPAVFPNNARWKLHAQAFYTAEVLGLMEKFHTGFFNAIQSAGKPMASEAQIKEFFIDLGVKPEEFDETFGSFAVVTKVQRAADLTRRSGITGVPSIVVQGKYRVDGPMAKTYHNFIRIIDHLVAQETAARQPEKAAAN